MKTAGHNLSAHVTFSQIFLCHLIEGTYAQGGLPILSRSGEKWSREVKLKILCNGSIVTFRCSLFQQTRLEKLYYFLTNISETLHTWSSAPNATSDDRFFQNSFYFRFYGLFPVFICLICKKSQIQPIFTHYSFKWSVRLKHNSREKNFGLRSNVKFGVI